MTNVNEIAEHLKEIRKITLKDNFIDDFYLSVLILFMLFMPFMFPKIDKKEEVQNV